MSTLAAARFLLCPQGFNDRSLADYMSVTSSRRYREYQEAVEFDAAKKGQLLKKTRLDAQKRASENYQTATIYALVGVDMLTRCRPSAANRKSDIVQYLGPSAVPDS